MAKNTEKLVFDIKGTLEALLLSAVSKKIF